MAPKANKLQSLAQLREWSDGLRASSAGTGAPGSSEDHKTQEGGDSAKGKKPERKHAAKPKGKANAVIKKPSVKKRPAANPMPGEGANDESDQADRRDRNKSRALEKECAAGTLPEHIASAWEKGSRADRPFFFLDRVTGA